MASAIRKITLSVSRDIPFNKLVLSQSNVRRTKAGVSIEDLAEDIARRGLLQSLNVRPVVDDGGTETGTYEIPAGGRRYRALERLVKQKRLAKTAPIPCIVREADAESSAEEDSLAENVQRVDLHPLDQFRAFKTLVDQGLGEEEIAARFFVTPAVVRQRLRLAAVSPRLLDLYAEDGMTLEQLMAFTVNHDHERQDQVWAALANAYSKEPYVIRRHLTEGAVRASDKRALFVGAEAYEAAGGVILRDLFEADDGGWLQDPTLLDRLVREKLKSEAEAVAAEGWKWVTAEIDFPYGHTSGLSRIYGEAAPLIEEDELTRVALQAEHERLEEEYDGVEELPDEVDARFGEIEEALAAFENRPVQYNPAETARAGVFVSIDRDGRLRVDRGYVRPEDNVPEHADDEAIDEDSADTPVSGTVVTVAGDTADEEAEDDALRPLPDRLVTELTAHRTLALRDGLARDPDTAFLAVLHALCLSSFYHYGTETCLEITAKQSGFTAQAPGLADTASAKAVDARHEEWNGRLPESPSALWDVLVSFDRDDRMALFAHCAALTVNVVKEPWNRRTGALAHGDILARAVGLDMAAAGWTATVDAYLGRVPKTRILEAVREAKGEAATQRIDHLKKADMAREAERLLDGTGWLPEPLRPVAPANDTSADVDAAEPEAIAAE